MERIMDLATLRARIAEGCRVAADRYRSSGLPCSLELAARLEMDAQRNEALAREASNG